jgi:hypothetical protein
MLLVTHCVVDAGALLLLGPGLLLLESGLDEGHSLYTIVVQSESNLHSPALVETAKFLQNGTLSEDIWQ